MAFDSKRLKMFKYLDDLSQNRQGYAKRIYNSIKDICVFCGSIYATNGVVLVKVDYPEFEHMSDDVWSVVDHFCDDDGKLLEKPFLVMREKQFNDNRIFDKFFTPNYDEPFPTSNIVIDARVLESALKPFKIYGICPYIYVENDKMHFSGHNKEVSIRLVAMGKDRQQ